MLFFSLAAIFSVATSLPTNEVSSSLFAEPKIPESRFTLAKHGYLRGKMINWPRLKSAPVVTEEILTSNGESLPDNIQINDGLTGWSDAKKTELARLLDEQTQNELADEEFAGDKRALENAKDPGVISTQPEMVDLPLDHPLASRLGSPFHYTDGDVSHNSYYSCDNENGYRPTTDELKEFRDMLYTEGRRNKGWIKGHERTVAQYKAGGKEIDWVEHGEKYNKCCCCCKTWTVQARKLKWEYDATCKYRVSHQNCSGFGTSRVCTTYYTTGIDRVKVTPYVETSPCCCEIIGCCGHVGARIRGNV